MMNVKETKISTKYNQILCVLIAFAAFSAFTLLSGKFLDRTGSALILMLAISGFIAFYNDRQRWRKQSAR
jgi:hypothetical protein